MTISIYLAVNKNGDVRMFTDEPKRNEATGKWESKHPFVNSVLYKEFVELVSKTNINWEHEPENFQLEISHKKQ